MRARGNGQLIIYSTLGDSISERSLDIPIAAAEGGADVIEVGIATPSLPRDGSTLARSFDRVELSVDSIFQALRSLCFSIPHIKVYVVVHPENVRDLGQDVFDKALAAGVSGFVFAGPELSRLKELGRWGIERVPVLPLGLEKKALTDYEQVSSPATYRALSSRAGGSVEWSVIEGELADARSTAFLPFWAGFGIRSEQDIALVARHADGVVMGSELYRALENEYAGSASTYGNVRDLVRSWKDVVDDEAGRRS